MKASSVEELPQTVQLAVALFRDSGIGTQLADRAEVGGRCKPASMSFISALRHVGEDGLILEFAAEEWWHHTVLLRGSDIVVDWTSVQFLGGSLAAAHRGYPTVTTRAEHEHLLGEGTVVDPENRSDWYFHNVRPVMPWDVASRRVPPSERGPIFVPGREPA